jgi:hypothetical protein
LESFRAFQQIELHGLALVQGAVTVFLDCGKMYEHIFPRGALDKTVPLSPIEPLDCAFFSHKFLLIAKIKSLILREAFASYYPLGRFWVVEQVDAARSAEQRKKEKPLCSFYRRGKRARIKHTELIEIEQNSTTLHETSTLKHEHLYLNALMSKG